MNVISLPIFIITQSNQATVVRMLARTCQQTSIEYFRCKGLQRDFLNLKLTIDLEFASGDVLKEDEPESI